ncbi:hypothetical protein KM043_012748 [Ampulex compressa]|nr:hypothetical protein KM043_012748 [Ampulex compressa]
MDEDREKDESEGGSSENHLKMASSSSGSLVRVSSRIGVVLVPGWSIKTRWASLGLSSVFSASRLDRSALEEGEEAERVNGTVRYFASGRYSAIGGRGVTAEFVVIDKSMSFRM